MTDSDAYYDEYDYVDPVPAALECPICRSPLVDPVQTPTCDHLFCRACLERSLSLNPSCPIDRTHLDSVDKCSPPHRAILHLLGELRVNYNGEVVTRDEADGLARRKTAGPASGAAAATTASNNPDNDDDCDNDHEDEEDAPAACDYCTLVLPRSTHPSHLLTTCAVVPLPCPHARRGCPYSGPRTLLEQDHLPSECVYEPLRAYLDRTDEVHARLEGDNWELRLKVATMERTIDALVGAVQGLQASLGDFAPPVAALPRSLGVMTPPTEEGAASTSSTTTTGRPRPTKRAASSPSTSTATRDPSFEPIASAAASSSSRLASATATPVSPLSSTLSHLESTQSHLSSSLSTLLQSHSHSLATTRAVQEELASLRTQLTGVRIQMGGVMRDVYGAGSGGGNGGGAGRRQRGGGGGAIGGYGREQELHGAHGPSLRAHRGLGSSGSSDEDLPGRDLLHHHHHHHAGPNSIPLSSPSSFEDEEEDEDEAEYYQHPYGPPSTSRSVPGPARLGHVPSQQQFPLWRPTAAAGGGGLAPGTAMPMPFPNGMRPIVPGGLYPAGGAPHYPHGMAIPGMMGVGGIGNGLVKL